MVHLVATGLEGLGRALYGRDIFGPDRFLLGLDADLGLAAVERGGVKLTQSARTGIALLAARAFAALAIPALVMAGMIAHAALAAHHPAHLAVFAVAAGAVIGLSAGLAVHALHAPALHLTVPVIAAIIVAATTLPAAVSGLSVHALHLLVYAAHALETATTMRLGERITAGQNCDCGRAAKQPGLVFHNHLQFEATLLSLLGCIWGSACHSSFSGSGSFVTKCVSRRDWHIRSQFSASPHPISGYVRLMQNGAHILIVDDHREIRELVSRVLVKEGFRVAVAADGRAMRAVLADSKIDLILLDLMLPGEDGLSLCRSVRAESNIPIIMLTAKGDEIDRVIGLEMGADDYMPKPFGSRELIARIRAVLRRSHDAPVGAKPEAQTLRFKFDRWTLDVGARELLRHDGVTLPLSTGEYDLLLALVERPQRVLNRDQLLDLARGRAATTFDRSIDTQISRLRKKLEADPADPKIIKTVWGGGYTFTPAVTRE